MRKILIDLVESSTSLENNISLNIISFVKRSFISIIILLGLISGILIYNNLNNISTVIIVISSFIIFNLLINCVYKILMYYLLTKNSNIDKNMLVSIENLTDLINDSILIKSISLINMKDIRNKDNMDKIKELSDKVVTNSGKELKDRVLKEGGFINYNFNNNDSIREH